VLLTKPSRRRARELIDAPVRAAVESMNGARFVHDRVELTVWQVEIADAQKVKGLAPLACKTDRIDPWVLAELARRDLVPAICLPTRSYAPSGSGRAGGCTWSATARASSSACTPCPVSDLFGVRGRQLLARLDLPEPWHGTIEGSLGPIDELDREIADCERELRRLGADHRYVPLLCTVPGIGWVLAYTIAAELGDSGRFPSPRKLAGYSGLCPRAYRSGERDLRGPLAKQGPATRAGHSWRPPPTPAPTRPTATATSARRRGSASSAAPRSPRSTSPAGSPRRSGTCSPATNPSLRQAPPTPWPPDGP
jgi:Transposase IS116/IS110/IS902 family